VSPARLTFVVGKGGVGKSTVAAALALRLATRGRRVLLCGVGASPPAVPDVALATIDGEAAFGEYLATIVPAALARRLAGARLVRRFVAAAPGLRELMAIGKLAAEERRAGAWDTIVVDTPATGHALELLRMPAAAAAAFGGLVRGEAKRILGQLRAPARAAVWLVSTAEELPARETREAAEEVRARLGMRIEALVINAVRAGPPAPLPAGEPADPLAAAALRCGREQERWAARHARFRDELTRAIAAPAAVLPWLPEPDGPAAWRALGDALAAQLARGAP
jgi:anion-transporting  ArsA/GET3 family ATPase